MTDIVERLSDPRRMPTMKMRLEAADEIERLCDEVKLWKARVDEGAEIILGLVSKLEKADRKAV